MKNSFKTIPPKAEITPDVDTFRVIEDVIHCNRSYYCDGSIKLPDGSEVKAIIRYTLIDDGIDTTLRPIEYKEVNKHD